MNSLDKLKRLWDAQKKGMDIRFTKDGAWVKRPTGWIKTPTGHTWARKSMDADRK